MRLNVVNIYIRLSNLNIKILILNLGLARPLPMDLPRVLVQADIVLEPLEAQVALLLLIFTMYRPKLNSDKVSPFFLYWF